MENLFFLYIFLIYSLGWRILESAPLIYFQEFGGDILFRIHLDADSRTNQTVTYVVIAVKEHK